MIVTVASSKPYPQEHLAELEEDIVKNLQKPEQGHIDEITLDPRFKNFKLITTYPTIIIFVEENFAKNNEQLIHELIENSPQ